MTGDSTPEVLEVYVGNFNSPSYGVWWDGQRLVHESFLSGYEEREQASIVPSSAQWARFWRTMEEIDVWNWNNRQEPGKRFERDGVREGAHWSLTLVHDGRSVESAGDHGGSGEADPDDHAKFEAFAGAVSRLTGGYAFR